MKVIIISLGFLVFFISCQNKGDDLPTSLFKQNLRPVKKELVLAESELQNPQGIILVDTLLIALNFGGEYCLNIYNLSDNRSFKCIRKGKGSDELIMPFDMFYDEGENALCIFDLALNTLSFYSIDSLNGSAHPIPIKKVHFENKFFKALPLGNESFVGIGPFEGGRYALTNNGKLLGTFLDYPVDKFYETEKDNIKAMAYQGTLAKRPGFPQFILAIRNSGLFEICQFQYNEITKKKSLYSHLPDYEPIHEGQGYSAAFKPSNRFGYMDISVNKDYIFLLYSGRRLNDFVEDNTAILRGNDILVFDWDGNPIISFSFEEEITSFAVDVDNKLVYLLTVIPELSVLKYEIGEYL